MSRTWFGSLCPGSGSRSGQRSKSCLGDNSKAAGAGSTKLHGGVEHNERVCRAQELSSYAQGRGRSQVKGQVVPKIVQLVNR